MFDELKAPTFCIGAKRNVMWPSKYAEMRVRPGSVSKPTGELPNPLICWEEKPIFILLTLGSSIWWGIAPKYCFYRTGELKFSDQAFSAGGSKMCIFVCLRL